VESGALTLRDNEFEVIPQYRFKINAVFPEGTDVE